MIRKNFTEQRICAAKKSFWKDVGQVRKLQMLPEGLSHMIGSAMTHGVEKEEEVEVWQIPGQKEEEKKNINRQK